MERLDDLERSLLRVQAAGVDQQRRVAGDAELGAHAGVASVRPEAVEVHAQRQQLGVDPQAAQALGERRRQRVDGVEPRVEARHVAVGQPLRQPAGARAQHRSGERLGVGRRKISAVAGHDGAGRISVALVAQRRPWQVVGAQALDGVRALGGQDLAHAPVAQQQPVARRARHERRRHGVRHVAAVAEHGVRRARHDQHVADVGTAVQPRALGVEVGTDAPAVLSVGLGEIAERHGSGASDSMRQEPKEFSQAQRDAVGDTGSPTSRGAPGFRVSAHLGDRTRPPGVRTWDGDRALRDVARLT